MNQKQFYKSMAWRRSRHAYISLRMALDGGLCEVCKTRLGKIVHHIVWLDDINCNDPEIALNFENYRYECQECHNKEKEPGRNNCGRVRYGEDGEVYPID